MPSGRPIKSVLHNFLGTLTSRYTSFRGYWLFGFIVAECERVGIDLGELKGEQAEDTPMGKLEGVARWTFWEQAHKAGMTALIARANLVIERGARQTFRVNAHDREGWQVRVIASAVSCQGRQLRREVSLFVAPNDPELEFQSHGRE